MIRNLSIPDKMRSLQEWLRYNNCDIPDKGDGELQEELYAFLPLLWRLPSDDWRRKRVILLQDELARRRIHTNPKPSPRPKPRPQHGVQL
jgi:hypothetical protein